ncbi:MAG: CpsD/CapB family tyrosine-protein kinase [Candidatus Omnitrophica bacterium]|nr:CpsD/CapB family tyrosine-protein kinase [Candidatus Omnitrophota bacterium]MBU1995928.1 CpsD/CapB family tyrosine-protein kinase [Candidatus Omnitrophota bacterium]
MGKITNALQKAAEDRLNRMDKIAKIKETKQLIVRKEGTSNIDPRIVTYYDTKALISEQYKILRTNLMSLGTKKQLKTIVVTSSIHSEGKTVSSLNLAISLAQAVNNPKVLVVDCDLRRGRMAKYLGIKNEIGFSEYLKGEAELSDIIFKIDIENLNIISSGKIPENPSELLSSKAMTDFLADVKSQFDFVIIDTPPIISVTDSGIIGAQSDGVLMVIQAGRTQRGIVRRAEELLEQAQANVLGHILTNIQYHLPEYIYRYL